MTNQRILPLGFVDKTTEDGAIMLLTNPSDSHSLSPETSVTLQMRSAKGTGATATARGFITAIGYVTATFRVVETRTDTDWPDGELILRRGTPVYQALPNSFIPDPARTLTDEQSEGLRHLATRYRETNRPGRQTSDSAPRPSRNGAFPDQQKGD